MIKTTTFIKKLTIQKCKIEDSYTIHKIFNESVSKGYAGTKKIVKFNTHQNWLKKKLLSKNNFIFVAKFNKIIIGYIRFDNIYLEKCEISIALKNQFINKGFGSKFLKRSITKLIKIRKIKTITSKVKKNNTNSIKFFLKNNFSEIDNKKKTIHNYRYFKLNLR